MRSRIVIAAVPTAVVLLAGCGGHKSAGDARQETSAATAAARPATPSATPTPSAFSHGEAALKAQFEQALAAAEMPFQKSDFTVQDCAVEFRGLDVGKKVPRSRENVVAFLRSAGWKDAPDAGTDESHLTGPGGWEVFVTRSDWGKLNGTGSPVQDLALHATC